MLNKLLRLELNAIHYIDIGKKDAAHISVVGNLAISRRLIPAVKNCIIFGIAGTLIYLKWD